MFTLRLCPSGGYWLEFSIAPRLFFYQFNSKSFYTMKFGRHTEEETV